MIILALIGFMVSILLCIAEAIYERDWPRETWKYAAMFAIALFAAAAG
jgi:hypothetical protein